MCDVSKVSANPCTEPSVVCESTVWWGLDFARVDVRDDEHDGRAGRLAEDEHGHVLAIRGASHRFDAEDRPERLELFDEGEHVRMARRLAVIGLLGDRLRLALSGVEGT